VHVQGFKLQLFGALAIKLLAVVFRLNRKFFGGVWLAATAAAQGKQ